MASLEILLGDRAALLSPAEKEILANRKNECYRAMLSCLTPADVLPGVDRWLAYLRRARVRVAIGSSSRNAQAILEHIDLADAFDAVVDGSRITRSKPDPEVFLLASAELGVPPDRCLVVEDAPAGVEAALAAGMHVLAVGSAARDPRADLAATSLATIPPEGVGLPPATAGSPHTGRSADDLGRPE